MSDNDGKRDRPTEPAGLPNFAALAEALGAAVGGATRMTRDRAQHLAERLLSQAGLENVDLGEAASGASTKINQLTEEILAARKANRAMLQRTVAAELEKSLNRVGLARAEEVAALRDEVARLRNELTELSIVTGEPGSESASQSRAAAKAPAKKTAKKATGKSSAAAKKSSPAASSTAKKASKKATKKSPTK